MTPTDTYTDNSSSKKRIYLAVFSGLIVIALCLAASYFLFWRVSDKDIDDTALDVKSLSESSDKITKLLQNIYFTKDVTQSLSTSIANAADTYQKSLATLATSKAVKSSGAVGSAYSGVKDTLSAYGTVLSDTSKSIRVYLGIASECGVTVPAKVSTVSSVDGFNQLASACNNYLKEASSINQKTYFNSFLTEYSTHMSTLVDWYKVSATTNNSSVADQANANISLSNVIISNDLKWNARFNIPTAPVDSFQKLNQALQSQKASLLR
jgi:hypothetical protein